MSLNICTYGADREYDEVQYWVVSSGFVFFTSSYVSRSPKMNILVGFIFQVLEFFFTWLAQTLQNQYPDSKTAQWITNHWPLSFFLPVQSAGLHEKNAYCIESFSTLLFFDPIIYVGGTLLWSIVAEKLCRARYKEKDGLPVQWRRPIYYSVFIFTSLISATKVFDNDKPVSEIRGRHPDLRILIGMFIFILTLVVVPLSAAIRHGVRSMQAVPIFYAYGVYLVFSSVIVVYGILGRSLLHIKSAWIRTVSAYFILLLTALLFKFITRKIKN
jgi:hypothetical protein